MCVCTWISILVYVSVSTQRVSKACRHVAGGPFALQDLTEIRDLIVHPLGNTNTSRHKVVMFNSLAKETGWVPEGYHYGCRPSPDVGALRREQIWPRLEEVTEFHHSKMAVLVTQPIMTGRSLGAIVLQPAFIYSVNQDEVSAVHRTRVYMWCVSTWCVEQNNVALSVCWPLSPLYPSMSRSPSAAMADPYLA